MNFIFFFGWVVFLKIQTIQEVFDGVFFGVKLDVFSCFFETFSLKRFRKSDELGDSDWKEADKKEVG